MQKCRKILAAILALLMLVSLVACAVPDDPEPPTSKPSGTQQQPGTEPPTETTELDTTHPQSGLPSKDYGGQDFRILGRGDQSAIWGRVRDIVYDSELVTTNSINEAVRDRNQYIEDLYKVNIKGIFVNNGTATAVKSSKNAGRDDYDIIEDSFAIYANLIDEGFLEDLNTISPYLDLTQSYWNQNCRTGMSIAHVLYFCSGDIMTSDKEGCWAMTFNRDIINNDNALEDPYALVDAKKWTYDKMYEMAAHVCNVSDYSPDDYFNVTWGVVSGTPNNYLMWQGSGNRLILKDDVTDIPYLGPLTEAGYDAMLDVAKVQYDKQVTLLSDNIKGIRDVNFDGVIKIFQTGHALFNIGSLTMVEWMREHDTDFGVLPLPKAFDEQEAYYTSMSSTYAYAVAIPTSNQNHEFTAIITQALACESTTTVIEGYYDKTLVHKGLRRPEDVRMLDLMFNARLYDLSQVFSWASSLISKISAAKTEAKVKDIKSKYDGFSTNINNNIKTFLEKHGLASN